MWILEHLSFRWKRKKEACYLKVSQIEDLDCLLLLQECWKYAGPESQGAKVFYTEIKRRLAKKNSELAQLNSRVKSFMEQIGKMEQSAILKENRKLIERAKQMEFIATTEKSVAQTEKGKRIEFERSYRDELNRAKYVLGCNDEIRDVCRKHGLLQDERYVDFIERLVEKANAGKGIIAQ